MGDTYTAPTSIPYDDDVDAYAGLQAWIDTVPNGTLGDPNTITFPVPDVRYLLNGGMLTFGLGRKHLVVAGDGCTFAATTNGDELGGGAVTKGRGQWMLDLATDMRLTDMIVRGSRTQPGSITNGFDTRYEAQHNFYLRGAQRVEIDHYEAYDPHGDHVYMGRTPTFPNVNVSRDIHLHHFRQERCGRMGLSFVGCIGAHIHDHVQKEAQRAHHDIEANDVNSPNSDILIHDGEYGRMGTFWFGAVGWPSRQQNVELYNCHLRNPEGYDYPGAHWGLTCYVQAGSVGRRANWNIHDCSSDFAFGSSILAAMTFIRVDGVRVRDNVVPLQPNRRMYAVRTYDCCDVDVGGNTRLDGSDLSEGTTVYGVQDQLLVSNTANFEAGFACGPRPTQISKVPKPAPAIPYGAH